MALRECDEKALKELVEEQGAISQAIGTPRRPEDVKKGLQVLLSAMIDGLMSVKEKALETGRLRGISDPSIASYMNLVQRGVRVLLHIEKRDGLGDIVDGEHTDKLTTMMEDRNLHPIIRESAHRVVESINYHYLLKHASKQAGYHLLPP